MGDCGMVMSEAEISSLKETLCTQQELLQKLHNDLEAEREAAATAASEALSVILRLQGEKAAVKMEAEQYKRLAEEKICHAEESFAIIEDIITEREMEVADLEYQVQTYRYKLLSMGWVDPAGTGGIIFPGNLVLRNGCSPADSSIALTRGSSEPSLITMPETKTDMNLISTDHEQEIKKTGTSTSEGVAAYTDKINKLNMMVKELAGAKYASSRNKTLLASHAPGNSFRPCGSPREIPICKEADSPQKCASPGVLDVFEVPQVDEDCCSNEPLTKGKEKIDSISDEMCHRKERKPYAKEENDWLKKLLQSVNSEKHLCKPSNVAAIERGVPKPTKCAAKSADSVNQSDRESEIVESAVREEELKLLKEIREGLSLLQSEVKSQKDKKSSMTDDQAVSFLSEAMLHFWL